jgi:hypothetical protein
MVIDGHDSRWQQQVTSKRQQILANAAVKPSFVAFAETE